MFFRKAWIPVAAAMITGVVIGWVLNARQPVFAGGSTDRHEDFVMTTGPVNQAFTNTNNQFLNAELDGLWVLDYKSGKLLASTINRQDGKMIGFGEVDLVKEFEIAPRANVHFMMTTGTVVKGQSVLYLIETSTGKLGVYSMMASDSAGSSRILIRRHDMTSIRTNGIPPAVNVQNLSQTPQGLPNYMMQNQNGYPPASMQQQMQNPPMPQQPVNPLQQTGFNNPNK